MRCYRGWRWIGVVGLAWCIRPLRWRTQVHIRSCEYPLYLVGPDVVPLFDGSLGLD